MREGFLTSPCVNCHIFPFFLPLFPLGDGMKVDLRAVLRGIEAVSGSGVEEALDSVSEEAFDPSSGAL